MLVGFMCAASAQLLGELQLDYVVDHTRLPCSSTGSFCTVHRAVCCMDTTFNQGLAMQTLAWARGMEPRVTSFWPVAAPAARVGQPWHCCAMYASVITLLCNVRVAVRGVCMVLQLQLIVPQDTLAGSAAQVAVPADSRRC